MHTITIGLSPEAYKRLEEQAHSVGQAPEVLSRELLETALQEREAASSPTGRAVLQTAGRLRLLSATLRRKIIPGVTLDEVRTILAQATGPARSDIIREHRGPQP